MEHHLSKFLTTVNFIDYLQKQLRDMFYEKVLLKIFQNLQESTCVGVSFSACTFIKKGTLTQVFLVTVAYDFSCLVLAECKMAAYKENCIVL